MNRRASHRKSPEIDKDIPSYVADQVISTKYRYYNNTGSTVSVTKELPICPYGVSYNSNNLILPFKSVRLKKVKMWCLYNPSVGIADNTINVTLDTRRLVRPIEWSDTASFQSNAFIGKKFSKFDPCGQWYTTAIGETNPEITFQMPKGAVLELTLDYIMSDGANCAVSTGPGGFAFPRIYTNRISTSFDVIGKANLTAITM